MKDGFPKVETKGRKTSIDFLFPRFNDTIVYAWRERDSDVFTALDALFGDDRDISTILVNSPDIAGK